MYQRWLLQDGLLRPWWQDDTRWEEVAFFFLSKGNECYHCQSPRGVINHGAESEKMLYAKLMMKDAKLQSSSWSFLFWLHYLEQLWWEMDQGSQIYRAERREKSAGALWEGGSLGSWSESWPRGGKQDRGEKPGCHTGLPSPFCRRPALVISR